MKTDSICGVCISKQRYWDYCFSAFEYKDSIKQLITQFKFHRNPALGNLLGCLLYQHIAKIYIDNNDSLPEYLIPVPMHHSQLKYRGFNQSLILCKTISALFDIPILNAIKKTRKSHTQKGLSSLERKKTIKNSFRLNAKNFKSIDINKVVIIDDVMTTGSTASEIAKTLKKSGVPNIDVWVLART